MTRFLFLMMSAALLTSAAHADPYPADVRQAFLEACTANMPEGVSGESICNCVLLKMEAEISVETLGEGTVPDDQIEGYVVACMGAEGLVADDGCLTEEELIQTHFAMYDEDELDDMTEQEADLDGQGAPERILGHISCGTTECTAMIFQKCEDDRARLLATLDGFEITVLNSQHNGYKDIQITGRDVDDDERPISFLNIYHFDGVTYTFHSSKEL